LLLLLDDDEAGAATEDLVRIRTSSTFERLPVGTLCTSKPSTCLFLLYACSGYRRNKGKEREREEKERERFMRMINRKKENK
jgi:hypothetical protein